MRPENENQDEAEWFAFTTDSINSLPPEQQKLAHEALARHSAMEPLAEVVVRIFRLEPGGSEVRIKTRVPGTPRPSWYADVGRIASQEVLDAAETFGSPHEPPS